ncbi:MAG: HD domain-containing protein [Clostridiales bacterium]|nr:HD domain-containing protein [Clostridiales bacterium]
MKQIIQMYNMLFFDFISKYDTTNTNIVRKIIHSYSVAEKCFTIACKLNLNEDERNFSYLLGLFHDLGRFEQWKLYKTYSDKKSVDHGDLSYEIIYQMQPETLFLTEKQFQVLLQAIKYHTKPYCGNDEQIIFYNEMIKNADAFCNVITTANGAQQMTITKDGVTEQYLNAFLNLEPLYTYSPNTKLDRALFLTACTYYVKYPFLKQEILDNNYIDAIYSTFCKYLNEEDKLIYKNAINILKQKLIKNNKTLY